MNATEALAACGPLIRRSARRRRARSRYGFELRELEQVAAIGVLKALRRYDPAQGPIQPYASIWIDRELREFCERFSSPLSAMRTCGTKNARAQALDELRTQRRAAGRVEADEHGEEGDPEARIDASRAVERLTSRVGTAHARLVLDYAVAGKTFAEVGAEAGFSRQRAQQVYARAVGWMRRSA